MQVETKKKLEEWLDQNLDYINQRSLTEDERKAAIEETKMAATVLKEIEEAEAKATDAEERRKIEEFKTKAMIEIEQQKQRFSWSHFLADCGKTIGMTVVSFELYKRLQAIILEFEKTGHITSTAGRQLKLPDPFGKTWKL